MGPRLDHSIMNDKEPLWAIPKLTPNGSNWVTFKTCFLFAMAGHDVNRHFDGSDSAPQVPPTAPPMRLSGLPPTKIKVKPTYPLVKRWKHNEHVACAQLAQVVSDSLLIRIQHAASVAAMWKIIVAELNHKGHMVPGGPMPQNDGKMGVRDERHPHSPGQHGPHL